LRNLVSMRQQELAVLRAVGARWDSLARNAREFGSGRAEADARRLVRAAVRAVSSAGLSGAEGERAAEVAEAVLRDAKERDEKIVRAVLREVVNPSRPHLQARRVRLEEEVAALEFLIVEASPKRVARSRDRTGEPSGGQSGPRAPASLWP